MDHRGDSAAKVVSLAWFVAKGFAKLRHLHAAALKTCVSAELSGERRSREHLDGCLDCLLLFRQFHRSCSFHGQGLRRFFGVAPFYHKGHEMKPTIATFAVLAALGLTSDRWDDLLYKHVAQALEQLQMVIGAGVGFLLAWLHGRRLKALHQEALEAERLKRISVQRVADALAKMGKRVHEREGLDALLAYLAQSTGAVPVPTDDENYTDELLDGVDAETLRLITEEGKATRDDLDASVIRIMMAAEGIDTSKKGWARRAAKPTKGWLRWRR